MKLEDHPTVRRLAARGEDRRAAEKTLDGGWLRRLALACGAYDSGLVELARPGLDSQRDEILRNYPWTRSLLSFVVRMAREPVRGAPRSVANLEFHRAGEEINEVGAAIVAKLEVRGIRAVNPSMGFPMEMYQAGGGAIWVVSHKPVAVEAGLGHMGIHRNLIHPKFGNFVLLGTILIGCEASDYDHPQKARSISPPVSRTIIVSSLAASPIGSSRSPMRAMRLIIAVASATRKLRPCGKALAMAPITSRPTVWRSVRLARMSLVPTCRTGNGICRK
jgi:hypothetical protein